MTFQALLHGLWEDFQHLERRVEALDKAIEAVSETRLDAKRLRQLRGIGPLTSTAPELWSVRPSSATTA